MKKIKYITVLSVVVFAFFGCEDILDTKNLYEKDFDNYYKTPTDINEAMAGVYSAFYTTAATSDEHIIADLLSDIQLAGGGPDDAVAKYIDGFTDPSEDTYKDLWVETYRGVYRCNAIIESMAKADFTPYFSSADEVKAFTNQALGEAYFMRAFFMFRAAKFFGGMPLILKTDAPRDVPRSSFIETFSQIVSDLKTAVETMPGINASLIPSERYGHANKWVAEAYLARVYLFYTGYMANIEKGSVSSITISDKSTVDKAYVVAKLEDCIQNSGYELQPDFRNLWPYSYANKSAGTVVLPWAKDEGLAWAGQDGFTPRFGTGNKEVMFAERFSFGNWSWDKGIAYSNQYCLHFGIRSNSMVPFGEGWGWGTVHPLFVAQWDGADLRKQGSVLAMGDAAEGTDGYQGNVGDHETGFVNKKYVPIQHDGAKGVVNMFYYVYGGADTDFMTLNAQDFYLMRFADVLLMHSELTETATGMNEVRKRAHLGEIAYSLGALKEERLHEFAFEGLRWFDLVRWGDVDKAANNYYQRDVEVTNMGVTAKYNVTYRPETKGLLPIPESEIRLSNGAYKQNPGW